MPPKKNPGTPKTPDHDVTRTIQTDSPSDRPEPQVQPPTIPTGARTTTRGNLREDN